MSGTWTTLTNSPPDSVATTFLLTDGTVLAQGYQTNHWYRLTPDTTGSYANGTWATMADSVHGPLYYASGVLRDGRLIVAGGEYDFGAKIWLNNAEMYDPVANTWTTLPLPGGGWAKLGDAPGCVLPDGRFMVGHVGTKDTSIYDPATNAWTAAASKISAVGEESWSLLPDGTLHAVDCSNPPNAEKYVIAANTWVAAGSTPHSLVDGISEIGASVLLPDGRVFVIGATGFTALYTPPPIANQAGTWANGPTIPRNTPTEPLGAVDGPACLLPNGNVFFSAGPVTSPPTFSPPSTFFEYDPVANTITKVPASTQANRPTFQGRTVMLPTGQVLYTSNTATVELYTPSGGPDPTWRPTITSAPTLHRGTNTTVKGRQINGLSQCAYYGNDATQATNYPIARLRTGSTVYYCRTSNFSTMGLQTGSVIHSCSVFVPSSVPVGSYCLEIVANGISSTCASTGVTNKRLKEIKFEIKEKLELVDNLKEIIDINQKRLPDFLDIKAIRETDDIFERIQDDWVKSVRTVAESIDSSNEVLARTFIKTGERPELEIDYEPQPLVEDVTPVKISADEAERFGDKIVQDGGREKPVGADEIAFHEMMHNLWRSKGEGFEAFANGIPGVTKGRVKTTRPKKSPAKKAAAEKAPPEQATAKKAPPKKAPPKKTSAKKAPPKKAPTKRASGRPRRPRTW